MLRWRLRFWSTALRWPDSTISVGSQMRFCCEVLLWIGGVVKLVQFNEPSKLPSESRRREGPNSIQSRRQACQSFGNTVYPEAVNEISCYWLLEESKPHIGSTKPPHLQCHTAGTLADPCNLGDRDGAFNQSQFSRHAQHLFAILRHLFPCKSFLRLEQMSLTYY